MCVCVVSKMRVCPATHVANQYCSAWVGYCLFDSYGDRHAGLQVESAGDKHAVYCVNIINFAMYAGCTNTWHVYAHCFSTVAQLGTFILNTLRLGLSGKLCFSLCELWWLSGAMNNLCWAVALLYNLTLSVVNYATVLLSLLLTSTYGIATNRVKADV